MVKELSNKFEKLKQMTKIAEPVVDVNDVSRIASGVTVKGDIISPGDLRIDGVIDGKVVSKTRIVVGEGAKLKGSLYCDALDFWGSMDGDIYVRGTLSIKAGSKINGSVNVRRFEVEMGAEINGSCHMLTEEAYDKLI